jgi:hypothetical protein
MASFDEGKSDRQVRLRTPTALSVLGATMLAGCAAQTGADLALANVETNDAVAPTAIAPTAVTPTERLADDLAGADLAFEKGDKDALALRLRSIELAGAKPSSAHEKSILRSWRDSAMVSEPSMRGRVLGPAYYSGSLAAGARISTEQVLLGGKAVSIAAGTAPKDSFRLRIARGDGKVICERSPAHARECRFVPTYTQRYHIELYNAGVKDARYHLVLD